MALTVTPPGELGSIASDFNLPGVDGKSYSLKEISKDAKAVLVVFMCNHCPYVQAVDLRINALAREYFSRGVKVVGINSNDPLRYPDDNFEAMRARAKARGYVFPYLQDLSQEVAKSYGAVCTPDYYLYEHQQGCLKLRYRGRLDDNWKDEKAVARRDLADAIEKLLAGRPIDSLQPSSMGCSIKWKP